MGIFSKAIVNSPKRSLFNLSYSKKFTTKFGKLIPTMCDEVIPGDVVSLGNSCICRMAPMNAPVLDEIIIKSETFFVPYRLLWPDWEKFITGVDSSVKWDPSNPPEFEAPVPCKVVRPLETYASGNPLKDEYKSCTVDSLQDYFGFPVNLFDTSDGKAYKKELSVNAFPWLAYYKIWNDYYRDENLEDEINLSSLFKDYKAIKDLVVVNSVNNGQPLNRSWKKDYFTSALPFLQKGTSPALPIYGTGYADFSNSFYQRPSEHSSDPRMFAGGYASSYTADPNYLHYVPGFSDAEEPFYSPYFPGVTSDGKFFPVNLNFRPAQTGETELRFSNTYLSDDHLSDVSQAFVTALNRNQINTSNMASVSITQFWLIQQIQRFLQINAMCGTRYTEFLRSHFSVAPRDERLDRAEFIGSTTQSVVVSEVLQTAQTTNSGGQGSVDNSLGTMAGHGLSVAGNKVGRYRVKEFGLIMTLTSIFPKASYQQGINRQWLRQTKYDYAFPEFTALSEQNLLDKELYVDSNTDSDVDNETQWGFQGRYNELRSKNNLITGHFRSNYDDSENSLIESGTNLPYSLDYWHLGRFFGSKPELNKDFINIDEDGDQLNRIFVAPSEDYCLVDFTNYFKAFRPLPYMAVPGAF